MKNNFHLVSCFLLLVCSHAVAQYNITSNGWLTVVDSSLFCTSPRMSVILNSYAPGLNLTTYFGDGTFSNQPIMNGGGYGYADVIHNYTFPGTYTLKYVVYNGAVAIDSVISKHEYLYCGTLIVKSFHDVAGTGIYDSAADNFITMPCSVEVSKNGIRQDTVPMSSGLYYPVTGTLGDIYSFKIIDFPAGISLTSPAGGIIYDTIRTISNQYVSKYFGFKCGPATSFDLAINPVIPVTGIHDQWGNIYVTNSSCDPVNATVTLSFSPKYSYHPGWVTPTPSMVSGNTITWNLTGIVNVAPVDLYYAIWDDSFSLAAGDTVQEHIQITPVTGDADPSNNAMVIIDTVRAGCDPNEMSVLPIGNVRSGGQLKYTINFQNTGNDTAFNISVYDTLSSNVDVKSLNLVMSSATMNIAVFNYGGRNIVKFDFPNINLLDSSHHGLSTGAIIFTVNSLPGLPDGTTIFNHAGIFFDYNPVVMTDTVENIIGIPTGIATYQLPAPVKLYPNPANDELTIIANNAAYTTATVTNLLGQPVATQQISGAQTLMNVRMLTPGIYFLTLRGEGGVKVQKFEKL